MQLPRWIDLNERNRCDEEIEPTAGIDESGRIDDVERRGDVITVLIRRVVRPNTMGGI